MDLLYVKCSLEGRCHEVQKSGDTTLLLKTQLLQTSAKSCTPWISWKYGTPASLEANVSAGVGKVDHPFSLSNCEKKGNNAKLTHVSSMNRVPERRLLVKRDNVESKQASQSLSRQVWWELIMELSRMESFCTCLPHFSKLALQQMRLIYVLICCLLYCPCTHNATTARSDTVTIEQNKQRTCSCLLQQCCLTRDGLFLKLPWGVICSTIAQARASSY